MQYDDREGILAAGFIELPYGDWKYAAMELELGGKVCIVIDKDIKAIDAAPIKIGLGNVDAAPIKIGLGNDGAIVRVHMDNPRWSHSGAFRILKGKQP